VRHLDKWRCAPMEPVQTANLQCPYCWEQIEIVVDCTVIEQEYVEDCGVCCSPVVISVTASGDGEVLVEARMEND
jgi:hypothetical protein